MDPSTDPKSVRISGAQRIVENTIAFPRMNAAWNSTVTEEFRSQKSTPRRSHKTIGEGPANIAPDVCQAFSAIPVRLHRSVFDRSVFGFALKIVGP
jgi:hypothetical protein